MSKSTQRNRRQVRFLRMRAKFFGIKGWFQMNKRELKLILRSLMTHSVPSTNAHGKPYTKTIRMCFPSYLAASGLQDSWENFKALCKDKRLSEVEWNQSAQAA